MSSPVATNLASLRAAPEDKSPTTAIGFNNAASFDLLQRAARLLAASTLVPKEFQGNLPNCVIALNMAARIGADPLMVCQNLYVVHGRPGWSSQFLIATFNQCGRFSSMRFAFFGEVGKDDYGCRAYAVEKSTGETITGADITIRLAKAEGWYSKSGSKWQTMPQQMLMYRSAAWLVRAYAPEIAMGLQTGDEIHDVYDAERDGAGNYSVDHLADLKTAAGKTIVQDTGEIIEPEAAPAAPAAPTADEKQSAGPSIPALYQEALKLATKGSDLCLDLCRDLPDDMAGEIKAVYQGAVAEKTK